MDHRLSDADPASGLASTLPSVMGPTATMAGYSTSITHTSRHSLHRTPANTQQSRLLQVFLGDEGRCGDRSCGVPSTMLEHFEVLHDLRCRTFFAGRKPFMAKLFGRREERSATYAIIRFDRSQVVDSKRRDVRVVEGARLESGSGHAHRVILRQLFAQSIQRLPATECLSM